jgi:hypothetical protein
LGKPCVFLLPPDYPHHIQQTRLAWSQDATATTGPVDEVGLPLDVPRIVMCSTVLLRDFCVRGIEKVLA